MIDLVAQFKEKSPIDDHLVSSNHDWRDFHFDLKVSWVGGLVVSVLDFCSDDPSSILADSCKVFTVVLCQEKTN